MEQITAIFLPPNVMSVYQSLDCGGIAMLMKNYTQCILYCMLGMYDERQEPQESAAAAKIPDGTKALDKAFAPHLHDVMDICFEVWNEIQANAIEKNCWRKCTLACEEMNNDAVPEQKESV
jgi:hypothetical protein